MIEQLKLPTDNLYKFLAIFGLVMYLGSHLGQHATLDRQADAMIAFNAEVNDPDGKFFENVAAVAHGVDLVAPQAIANKMEDLTPDARRAVMSFVMIEARMQDTFDKLNQMRYAGTFCMLFGFFFWFVMVQFHQDQLLRKSAKKGTKLALEGFQQT